MYYLEMYNYLVIEVKARDLMFYNGYFPKVGSIYQLGIALGRVP